MAKPEFSICILTYNHPHLLDQRLAELSLHVAGWEPEVCVLDNGGERGPVQLMVARHLDSPMKVAAYRVAQNLGFGPGFNFLVTKASGKHIILLSDDVSILGDCLRPLIEIFNRVPNGVICHRLIDWKAGWNQFGDAVIPYPEGYFLAMTRKTWDTLGGFDPQYAPYDYEDVDFGMTAREHGFSLVQASDLPVRHAGAGTLGWNPERAELTVRMRARFAAKWNLPNNPERP